MTSIETGMRLRLQETGTLNPAPDFVCGGCLVQLTKLVSKGAKLRAEHKAKEENKLMLWRNRVSLVKRAKALMAEKNFSDAAVSFEKYIRVLEIVYDKKPGELTPEVFKNDARKEEMTIIAAVYWDLMRVYDSSNRYADRQNKAAEKLAEFARFTPIFPFLVRKAESFSKSAKNPQVYQKFLKLSNAKRARCFIATAAFDGVSSDTVLALCRFRDEFLRQRRWGRACVYGYYRLSPPIAALLDRQPRLKPLTRAVLRGIAKTVPKSARGRDN